MFRFKQFQLDDSGATMKLGTDAVLLGVLASPLVTPRHILDIGTGCGVIALMMAQRFPDAIVDAIDIDKDTAVVAERNFDQSPWSPRLKALHLSLQELRTHMEAEKNAPARLYDLIVSNPPYFTRSLKNDDPRKRIARHDDTLPLEQLFDHACRLLSDNGTLALVLPIEQQDHAVSLAQKQGLFTGSGTTIHNRPGDPAKRIVFSFHKKKPQENREDSFTKLFMREEDNRYSTAYIELTADFYLWLTH